MNFKNFKLLVESNHEVLTRKSMHDLIKIIEENGRFSVKDIEGDPKGDLTWES